MDNLVQFPNKKKEHIFKMTKCSGCQKELKEEDIEESYRLPYKDKVEYIVLCGDCVKELDKYNLKI